MGMRHRGCRPPPCVSSSQSNHGRHWRASYLPDKRACKGRRFGHGDYYRHGWRCFGLRSSPNNSCRFRLRRSPQHGNGNHRTLSSTRNQAEENTDRVSVSSIGGAHAELVSPHQVRCQNGCVTEHASPIDQAFSDRFCSDVGVLAAELLITLNKTGVPRIVHIEGPRRYNYDRCRCNTESVDWPRDYRTRTTAKRLASCSHRRWS